VRIGITMLSDDPSWGGIGIYTREIVRNLLAVDRDNEYVLIYPAFRSSDEDTSWHANKYPNCREVRTRKSLRWTTYWDQVVVPPVARREKLDLLFNPFWSVPVFDKSYKKVLTVHGMDSQVLPKSLRLRGRIEWAIHSRLWVHRADAVISISDMMSRDLEKYVHLDAGRIRRIYHGCAPHFQPIEDNAVLQSARTQHGLPEKFILFVGMLFPQKNFHALVQAFKLLADSIPHRLVVIGRLRWKYHRDLRLIESSGLSKRVQFLQHVPNDDLPAIYNLADCFVFPSLYEAFGLVGVEAMACGCPVAAARAGALPEVLGDAAVFFDPNDVREMARSISALIHDPELRAQCIRGGLERARNFTWERTARETLKLFEELVR